MPAGKRKASSLPMQQLDPAQAAGCFDYFIERDPVITPRAMPAHPFHFVANRDRGAVPADPAGGRAG